MSSQDTALWGREEFWTADHATILCEGWGWGHRINVLQSEAELEDTLMGAPTPVTCRLQRVKKTGEWLTVNLSTVNGTEMGAQ